MADTLKLPLLAIGDPWHDAAYAVFDGAGLRHVEVERFTRVKYERLNPLIAAWLLDRDAVEAAGIFLFEEGRFFAPLLRRLASGATVDLEAELRVLIAEQHGSLSPEQLLADRELVAGLVQVFERIGSGSAAVEVMDHHFCHAANAFLSSTFDQALAVSLDGGGTHCSRGRQYEVHGSIYRFDRARPLGREPLALVTDWSPGWAWTRMCEAMDLGRNDAGTVMAMAAYGEAVPAAAKLVRDQRLWAVGASDLGFLRRRAVQRHCRKLASQASDEAARFGLASALQDETEQRIREFLAPYLEQAVGVDLCLSGGVFLNCLAVGKIAQWFPHVGRIYLPPAPYDGGLAIGLAQAHLFDRGIDAFGNGRTRAPFASNSGHSLIAVHAACRSAGLPPGKPASAAEVAQRIGGGSIVGLFQGGSESGRRALGNRSIVADPRDPSNKDLLNRAVKKRQWFRPFAPMILHEEVGAWFEVPEGFESPYMSFAMRFRPGKGELVPAVLHRDGTARLQTVHRDLAPATHLLLSEWQRQTGVPILLNTSFNDSEPIVETPHEALATMVRSGIDAVYFADFELIVENPDRRAG